LQVRSSSFIFGFLQLALVSSVLDSEDFGLRTVFDLELWVRSRRLVFAAECAYELIFLSASSSSVFWEGAARVVQDLPIHVRLGV
jgi:hypothetical protein